MTKQKKNIYNQYGGDFNLAQSEKKISDFWNDNNIFEKSVENRPSQINGKNNEFIFYDGPPFANGLPHYGHLLTGFVKDIVARYQTIKGKKVERKFGWDCHGLPAEMEVEKELGVSGRIAINEYGVGKFNDACRTSVMKYSNQWKEYVNKSGRWVDFEGGYKTMDKNYMESVIWAFKELYNKGLLYEDYRVMPYSWKCETPLSNFETRLDNSYREKASKAVTVAFTLKDKPKYAPSGCSSYKMLVWTTTPWTLPSNLALAVGKDIDYRFVVKDDVCYIIADSLVGKYEKELGIEGGEIEKHPVCSADTPLKEGNEGVNSPSQKGWHFAKQNNGVVNKMIRGSDLVGLSYQPLFPYFKDTKNAFVVLAGDFVTTEDGTGIVHMAPGFGEDDQALCKANNIETICPVDDGGKFDSRVTDYAGIQVFDANDPIIIKLKQDNAWIKTEQYLHNYPHCWRTDTPLIYKAVPSWYVEVTKIKDRMVELNKQINWIPNHVKDGLFGKWLEGARDWSISRNRFWGCPVPVWKSDDPQYPRIDVYGSIAELEADFGVNVEDLHRPFIDSLVRPNPNDPTGKSMMRRVSDVLDCWFESGSMPYAQVHYPFGFNLEQRPVGSADTPLKEGNNSPSMKGWQPKADGVVNSTSLNLPADFIVEYTAQTRGWFYTLMVLSTALFDKPPFLNCICHGVILDENSQKLSKRLKNYPDPLEIFDKYGSDPMRWFMASSPVMRGNELNIDKNGQVIIDSYKNAIKPILNSYNFFALYANADEVEAKYSIKSENIMDRYILAKTKSLVLSVEKAMDEYNTPLACSLVEEFFEILNNWYIRRNRSRFWGSEKSADKIAAYDTLYTVLTLVTKAISPLLPFVSELIYKDLVKDATSVHLENFPNVSAINDEEKITTDMDMVRDICGSGLSIRTINNLRIRLPLSTMEVILPNSSKVRDYLELIKDEINVKEIILSSEVGDKAEISIKLNFKTLGKKLGGDMKEVSNLAKENKFSKLGDNKIKIGNHIIDREDYELVLRAKGDNQAVSSLSKHDGLVIIDTNITEELEIEGLARDIVRLIQQSRKDADFDVSDKIILSIISENSKVMDAAKKFGDYIKEQVLAVELNIANDNSLSSEQDKRFEHKLDGEKITIHIKRL